MTSRCVDDLRHLYVVRLNNMVRKRAKNLVTKLTLFCTFAQLRSAVRRVPPERPSRPACMTTASASSKRHASPPEAVLAARVRGPV